MTTDVRFTPLPSGPASCDVYPICNSSLTIPETYVVSPYSSLTAAYRVPSFSFLIEHKPSGKKLMYDLGIRGDWKETYEQRILDMAKDPWDPEATADTADILKDGGVDPATISAIIFSHFHWDHTGNISRFPNAELIGGPGTLGGGEVGGFRGDIIEQVEQAGRPTRPIDFDNEPTVPAGAFLKAIDYFGDGSILICQTAGHTKGHISALVRTTSSPATYVLLGGDTAHHPTLLCPCHLHSGLSVNTTFKKPTDAPSAPVRAMHLEPARAQDSITRTRRMEKEENVMVVVAHDFLHWRAWKRDGGIMFPGGRGITQWKEEGLKTHRDYDPSGYEHK